MKAEWRGMKKGDQWEGNGIVWEMDTVRTLNTAERNCSHETHYYVNECMSMKISVGPEKWHTLLTYCNYYAGMRT